MPFVPSGKFLCEWWRAREAVVAKRDPVISTSGSEVKAMTNKVL